MEFKEIEKLVDPFVLQYIKDMCTDRFFADIEIVSFEEVTGGVSYKGRKVYKHVVNEQKYMHLVREHYLTAVEPVLAKEKKKTSKRAKKELGKNVTQEEFLKTMFRDNFEHRKGQLDKQGRRINMHSFLLDIDPELRVVNKKAVAHSLEKFLEKVKKYKHFTPNMFISHQHISKELLTLLGVIVLDFDLDKVGMVMSKEQVFKYIKKKLKAEPAMIWDTKTKGNYQIAILLESMTATPKSVHLYEQIVKEMIYKLGDMCDLACYNANHIFSLGQNNARKKKFIRKYNETIYNIDDFRWLLHERDERRKKDNSSNNVVDFSREGVRRHEAIQALFAGEVSWRDYACFTLALVMRFLGHTQEECENYIISEWVPAVRHRADHPFTRSEALKCIKHGYSGKYRNFHSKWVTAVTGIDCNLKGFFKGYYPYQNQGIYVTDTEKKFKDFLRENGGSFVGKIGDIVEELEVKRTTLEDVIYKLRDNGEISYVSQRGRYAKTTFTLIEQPLEHPVIQLEMFKTIDEQEDDLNELEAAVHQMNAIG